MYPASVVLTALKNDNQASNFKLLRAAKGNREYYKNLEKEEG